MFLFPAFVLAQAQHFVSIRVCDSEWKNIVRNKNSLNGFNCKHKWNSSLVIMVSKLKAICLNGMFW